MDRLHYPQMWLYPWLQRIIEDRIKVTESGSIVFVRLGVFVRKVVRIVAWVVFAASFIIIDIHHHSLLAFIDFVGIIVAWVLAFLSGLLFAGSLVHRDLFHHLFLYMAFHLCFAFVSNHHAFVDLALAEDHPWIVIAVLGNHLFIDWGQDL